METITNALLATQIAALNFGLPRLGMDSAHNVVGWEIETSNQLEV